MDIVTQVVVVQLTVLLITRSEIKRLVVRGE